MTRSHTTYTNKENKSLKMERNFSRKSKTPLMKPVIWAASKQTTGERERCSGESRGDYELQEFARKGEGNPASEEETYCGSQDHEGCRVLGKGKKGHDVNESIGADGTDMYSTRSGAFIIRNETNADQFEFHPLAVKKVHDLTTLTGLNQPSEIRHTQNTPRRRRYHRLPRPIPGVSKTGVSEQIHQVRAETRAIREETRRFLEGSDDDDESEYQRDVSIERIERAEIHKIRAETRVIREETNLIKEEIRGLINNKRVQKQRKERHIRYSL